MALQMNGLPASSQLSSVLSEPPPSDHEDLGDITVELDTISSSPDQRSQIHAIEKNTNNMPSTKISKSEEPQLRCQSQRQSKRKPLYQAESSGDELEGGERQVTSSSKTAAPAKRNRSGSSNKPTPKPAAKRTKPAVDRKMKKWEPDFVTQNMKSPLVTNGIDLRTLLLQPAAWGFLSVDDKKEILSFFPSNGHILDANTPDARPNVVSLSSNDTFRHDAEEYVANIAKGMHDLEWLRQAWAAHHRRAMGAFDEFYIRKVEVDWSTDIPDDHRPEHLRKVKRDVSSSSSVGRDDANKQEAPNAEETIETLKKNDTSGNGTPEPKDLAEHSLDHVTNGYKAHTPDREIPISMSGVTDSITIHSDKPPKSNGGPRFEVIPSPPAESEIERVTDDRGTANGAVTEPTRDAIVGDAIAGTNVDTGRNTVESKASGGEITVAGDAIEV